MTAEEWAEVFQAGWDTPDLHPHMPAGNAVAVALAAMETKCREIAQRDTANSHKRPTEG